MVYQKCITMSTGLSDLNRFRFACWSNSHCPNHPASLSGVRAHASLYTIHIYLFTLFVHVSFYYMNIFKRFMYACMHSITRGTLPRDARRHVHYILVFHGIHDDDDDNTKWLCLIENKWRTCNMPLRRFYVESLLSVCLFKCVVCCNA